MDDALVLAQEDGNYVEGEVLILVLMDDALVQDKEFKLFRDAKKS